jgi:hypothetical protein
VKSLVVSLHDVSPHTWENCRRILAGIRVPVSLLVIPDHHGRGHFVKDGAFCDWLRERVAGGDEVVIHGYYHQRARREMESVRERLITQSYTAGEGEFFDISKCDALDLLGRALEEFHGAGFQPRGFIAPAWLLSDHGEDALRESGICYTTRLRTVSDLQNRREWTSQSLCWSVRAVWRRLVSLAWNASLFHRLESAGLMRIAVHPVDIAHPAIFAQIQRMLAVSAVRRKATTYEKWISGESGRNW